MRSLAITAPLLLALASATQAQVPQRIESGESITRAGQKFDFFHYIGLVGSQVTVTVESPSEALITFYEPKGEEMLHAAGSGMVQLDVVLPHSSAYLIGVSRKDASKPYKLSISATEPSLTEMAFAKGVGYPSVSKDPATGEVFLAQQCWVDPGRRLRHIYPGGLTGDSTIDGQSITTVIRSPGRSPLTTVSRFRFEGTVATRTVETAGEDQSETFTYDVTETIEAGALPPFARYHCR